MAWDCYDCGCDQLAVDSGFAGDQCQFSGCGVDSQGTGSFVTELESLYSCNIFGNDCNILPVDFLDSDPEIAFTIEFQVRRRGNWIGGTILKKFGCPSTIAPNFCDPSQYTTNWQIQIGDEAVGVPGGKIRFGAPGSGVFESTADLAILDGGFGIWQHVAITYDCCDPATSGLTIYVDGIFDSFFSKAAAGTFFDGRNRGNIYVLDDRNAAGPVFANFDLDEVRIWNVARTEAEINATRLTEVDLSDPDIADKLVYYLRLNESRDEIAIDGLTREYANDWETALVGDAMFQQYSPVFEATPLPGPGICSTDPF